MTYCATNVQGTEILQVDPTPPLVEPLSGSSELVGKGRCKIIRVLDCMGQLLVSEVFAIVWQDAWTVYTSAKDKRSKRCAVTYRGWQGC